MLLIKCKSFVKVYKKSKNFFQKFIYKIIFRWYTAIIMESKLKSVHRVQTPDLNQSPFASRSTPVKRILVSDKGVIKFNPDENNYVYLSRTDRHHGYYVFNKVMDIINENLRRAKANPEFQNANLPENFKIHSLFYDVNLNSIKDVQHFFSHYLPPQYVELVSLKYMNSFGDLLEECKVKNQIKRRNKNALPEVSDTSRYGGAYGLSDYWLELLKDCTLSSKTAKLSVDKFLDFIIDVAPDAKSNKVSLRSIMNCGSEMFNLLEHITYTELKNPAFYDKNNANRIITSLQAIEDYEKFNATKKEKLNHNYFTSARKSFKDEYHELTK